MIDSNIQKSECLEGYTIHLKEKNNKKRLFKRACLFSIRCNSKTIYTSKPLDGK